MEVDLDGFSVVPNVEAKFEGFSIREYVSNMRTVDATKCWPFGNEDRMEKEVNIDDLLPPIIVKKYRWWSHELELQAQSTRDTFHNYELDVIGRNESEKLIEEESDMVSLSPVCHECNDEQVDRRNVAVVVEAAANKGKRAKALKKRSIVEICAVAPPLQKDGEGDLMRTLKKKCKFKKEKLKKKISKKVVSIPNKEKSQKLKQQTAVSFNGLYSLSCNKKFSGDMLFSSIRKKKSNRRCLPTKKKHKDTPTFRLIKKLQKPNISGGGIPKSQKKASLGRKYSKVCDLRQAHEKNPCTIELSERHVRFSGKDDILGPHRTHSFSIDHSKSRSRSKSFLDTINASSSKEHCLSSNEDFRSEESSGSDDDVSSAADDGSDVQPLNESDSRDHFDMPSISRPQIACQKTVDNLQYKSVSLNQPEFNGDNFPLFRQGNSTISDRILQQDRTLPDRCNLTINARNRNGSRDSSTSGRMIHQRNYPTRVPSATNSMSYMKKLAQSSSSSSDINVITKERILPHIMNRNYNCFPPENRPLDHRSHKELMGDLSSIPNQNAFMFAGKSIDDNYFGLPLNSQGELIHLNSSGTSGFNPQRTGMVTGPPSISPIFNHVMPEVTAKCFNVNERHTIERTPQDFLIFVPSEKYLKGTPSSFSSSGFAVTESQGNRNTNLEQGLDSWRSNQPLYPWESEQTVRDISSISKQYGQVQNAVGTGSVYWHDNSNQMPSQITQPTMRLMGTDVTVGSTSSRKDSQGVENGQVWTDKEIIKEHRPISKNKDSSIDSHFHSERGFPSPIVQSSNHLPHLFDVRKSLVAQSFLQAQAQDCRSPYSCLNPSWTTNALSQSSKHGINEPPRTNMPEFVCPTISNFSDREPNLVPQSFPLNSCQHMHISPAEFKYKQNLPHVTKSVFQFPFLYPDCGTTTEPPRFHETSNLQHWLLQASLGKETVLTTSEPYSIANGLYFPPLPSVRNSPVGSYPYDHPITSHSRTYNSLGSASLAPHSLTDVHPRYKPTFDKNMGFKNKSKLKIPVRKLDLPSESKKRLAVKLDGFRRRTKMPKLGIQECLNASTRSNDDRGNSSSERQCTADVFEVDRNKDSSSIVRCNLKESNKDNLQPSFRIDSSKLNGITRSGPHKLSAGVKHILLPSKSIVQDNSMTTHSTILFPVTLNSGRIPEISTVGYKL